LLTTGLPERLGETTPNTRGDGRRPGRGKSAQRTGDVSGTSAADGCGYAASGTVAAARAETARRRRARRRESGFGSYRPQAVAR